MDNNIVVYKMSGKETKHLDGLIIVMLFVKILWFISVVVKFITKKYYTKYEDLTEQTEEYLHIGFTILIGILMVALYHHLTPSTVCISGHIKIYLYTFGILAILGNILKLYHKFYFKEHNVILKALGL